MTSNMYLSIAEISSAKCVPWSLVGVPRKSVKYKEDKVHLYITGNNAGEALGLRLLSKRLG